jgi:ABC-type glycerol-3-phosphate transport system substrate-binding protein
MLCVPLIIVGLVLLSACAAGPAATTEEAAAAEAAAEDVTVVYLGIGDSWVPDNEWVGLIEEGSGVDMDYQFVPSPEYAEKRNVLMAAGDYPDVIRINPTTRQFKQYLNDGLLIPIDEYLDKYPTVRDAFPAEVWENNRQADGMIYHIPRITGNLPRCLHYRTDWLEKLGMEEPTTLAEFRTFLERVRDEDPGNIGDPLIPFVPNRLDSITWSMEVFLSAFGVDHLAWVPSPDDPSQLVFANTLPALKDGLQWVRELFADGLMDPTFMVATDRGLFKFYAGNTAVTTDWPRFKHFRLEAIRNAHPDANADTGYICSLTGPTGITSGPMVVPNAQSTGAALTIAATAAEADAFFRVVNWQYTEGWDLMTVGVEGITYDVVDGVPVTRGRDAILNDSPQYDLYSRDYLFKNEPPAYFDYRRDNVKWIDVPDDMMSYVQGVLKDALEEKRHINYLVDRDDATILDGLGALQSLANEFAARVVLNPDMDIEEEWKGYLAALEANNLAGVTEAVNALNDIETINTMAAAIFSPDDAIE